MLRQSSSRSHRSKKLRASHSFQAFLLVAVAVWIVYQLTHSFSERRPVTVETGGGGNDAEPARRRLGRKGFVRFAGHASVDAIAGVVRSWSDDVSSDDPLSSKAGDGEGDEEDREAADEDYGADGDDADDGFAVAADEEDDGPDFQSQDGSRDDDAKAVRGGTQNGLNISAVATVNGTGTVLDGAAAVLLRNATTGAAADGAAPTLSGSAKNTSSVGMALLRGTGSAGDVGNKFLANSFDVGAPGAEKPTNNTEKAVNLLINKNGG